MNKVIEIPILNNEYKVIFCYGSITDIKKVLKSYNYSDDIQDADFLDMRGRCFDYKGCHPVIGMPKFPKTPEEIATLSHEATHAVEDIFRKINEPLGGEVFAHSIGAIVRTVLSKNRRNK